MNVWRLPLLFTLSGLLLPACAARRTAPPPPEVLEELSAQKERFEELRDQIRAVRLVTRQTPAPSTSLAPQTQEHGGVRATVAPISAEGQAWNVWPDGTARLFNDGVGYLWVVSIEAAGSTRWSAPDTHLAVNDTELVFEPMVDPEAILDHLVQGARIEAAFGIDGDLGARVAASGAFRDAYLDDSPAKGAHSGVLLFPAPASDLHAMAMQLTLGVDVAGQGVEEFVFLFE